MTVIFKYLDKTPRGIDKSVILRLAECDWLRSAQNIIITGPTGAGKTYLTCQLWRLFMADEFLIDDIDTIDTDRYGRTVESFMWGVYA
ncbi:MAG: ATP-binding protein [Desulfobacteraceae bacterium]|nr:ATP-binding protein [Desulfobacteraceae bacterium]